MRSKLMKILVAMMLAMALILSLAACGGSGDGVEGTEQDRPEADTAVPDADTTDPAPDSNEGDSSGDDWYNDSLAWAIAAGITDGNDPTGLIPREEFALIMYNYAKYKGLDTSADGYIAEYSDADFVSPWAEDAMKWANMQGLIMGRTPATLNPLGTTTRAEAATILMRFLEI